jgi:pantoate--beta-alanine ligase
MVRDFHLPLKIVVVPTVRDPDGVAMSSRNKYLSPKGRLVAVEFARLLREAARQKNDPAGWLRRNLKKVSGLKVDHVTLSEDRLCAAVWVGKTRLIDNQGLGRR